MIIHYIKVGASITSIDLRHDLALRTLQNAGKVRQPNELPKDANSKNCTLALKDTNNED